MSSHGHGPSVKTITTILITTFVLGFISGVILYLQGHTGNEGDGGIKADTNEFVILGYARGGCARLGCPSYRITDNGAYTYIERRVGNEEERFEDLLSAKQLATLTAKLKASDLNAIQATTFAGECPADRDGIAYTYTIEYTGTQYTFDSCKQNIEEYEIFTLLNDNFEIFKLMQTSNK